MLLPFDYGPDKRARNTEKVDRVQAKTSPLTQAFLDDHREMTRRVAGLLQALRRDDLPTALLIAALRSKGCEVEL